MAKKILFLCYCHENANEAAQLRNDLIAAGYAVWWDRDILPGQDWKLAIREALERSHAIVLCLSKELQSRLKSGVYPEISEAIGIYRFFPPGSIFLIPVRFSDCSIPPIEIDATRTLERIQYVDLFPESNRAEGLKQLLAAIRATRG